MNNNPLLSIVIPNYNYGRFLPEAIESILSQECLSECEVIIVDASSTDDSIDVIKRYAGKELCRKVMNGSVWHVCENLKWISELDKGQSDAFNKGFAFSSGRYLTWLNADEMYTPETLKSVLLFIKKHPDANWITANDFSFWDDTKKISSLCWGPHIQPAFFTRNKVPPVVFGPSAFFSREVFNAVGPFDVRLKYGMDTDLWQRMLNAGYHQFRLNRFCWAFRWHSSSKTFGVATKRTQKEKREEACYIREKGTFGFKKSVLNPNYLCWLAWRIIDGSLAVKYLKKIKYIGCDISDILSQCK